MEIGDIIANFGYYINFNIKRGVFLYIKKKEYHEFLF